jgi:hypothetical protein
MAKASDGTRVSATLTKPIAYDIFLDGQDRARASIDRIFHGLDARFYEYIQTWHFFERFEESVRQRPL